MMPDPEIYSTLLKFTGALSTLAGLMAWFGPRKGSVEEDQEVAEATDVVIDTLIDGDVVSKIDLHTGKNLRDQLTVQELEEMNRERQLRRFGRRN